MSIFICIIFFYLNIHRIYHSFVSGIDNDFTTTVMTTPGVDTILAAQPCQSMNGEYLTIYQAMLGVTITVIVILIVVIAIICVKWRKSVQEEPYSDVAMAESINHSHRQNLGDTNDSDNYYEDLAAKENNAYEN